MSEDSLLGFPCDYSIKVLGRKESNFRSIAETIVQAHYVDIDREKIKEKVSKNGAFLSLTFTVYAQNKDQIDALYRDLVASEDVLLVL
jgi:putative lipoic acid-binding regulatory protein